jgi:hypothetical protein
MKKLFISFLIIIVLGGGLVFASIATTDYEKVYQEFIKSTRADASLVKVSNFRINKFPTVFLSIEELSQEGKLTLKNVEIHFSLMSLLQFSPKITSLEIGEAKVFLKHDDIKLFNHDELISELISKDALSVEAKIGRLSFIESDDDIPLEIVDFIFASENEHVKFSGKIDDLGKIEGDFIESGNDVKLSLFLEDESSSLNLVENYKNSIFQGGKVDIKTSSLANRIAKLIPDINEITGGIDSSEVVEITFDLVPINHWMGIHNINITSDSIEGKGEMNLSKKSIEQGDIKLAFSKIDLVNWKKAKVDGKIEKVVKYGVNEGLDFNKNRLKVQIFLNDIKIDENNTVSDVNAKFSIEGDKLVIQKLSGNINKTGNFEMAGTVTQNSFRSLFNGKVYLNHKDLNDLAELFGSKEIRTSNQIPFSLSTDVKLSSVDVSIQNLLIKTAQTAVMGNVSTKFIGDSRRINANIKFTSVDADAGNFPGISQALSYAESLTEGMKEEDYLSKFIPIRKINSIGNYDITFDRLKAGNKLYEKVNFNLFAAPGKVSLEQLYIQDGVDWVDTSIALVAEGIKPTLDVKVHNGSIGVDFLSPSGMLNLRKKLLEEYDLSKIDISMNFAMKKIYEKGFELGKIRFNARNNKNLFDISKFDADVFGGRLQSSGSILLEPYTLNFVYALNSVGVQEIAKLLPAGTVNSGGLLSASGMWSTNGNRTDEQLYNLYTKSNIIAKDITVSNVAIDDLIQLLGNPNYNIVKFDADVKNSLLTGKTDISDLKTSVELSKGVFTMPSLIFKTKYSSASGSAIFDLYKWNLDANSIFSFFLAKPKRGRSSADYAATKMKVKAVGNVMSPKKEADTEELIAVLKSRNQK